MRIEENTRTLATIRAIERHGVIENALGQDIHGPVNVELSLIPESGGGEPLMINKSGMICRIDLLTGMEVELIPCPKEYLTQGPKDYDNTTKEKRQAQDKA